MRTTRINRYLELIRWSGVALAIFFAFSLGNSPVQQFNIFAIISVISVAGLTAVEGLFFAKSAARISGYGAGGAYQRQSAIHFLALALAIIIATLLNWGFFAYLGVYLVFLIFLTLSAINHLYEGVKGKFVTNTLLRPIMVIIMWIVTLYFLLPAVEVV